MSEQEIAALTTVLIADDHPIMRRGLKESIEDEPGLRVVAEEEDGRAAIERIAQLLPNVAILDIDMPEMTGLEVAQEVERRQLPTAIIISCYTPGQTSCLPPWILACVAISTRALLLRRRLERSPRCGRRHVLRLRQT